MKEDRMKRASGAGQGSKWTHPSVLALARSADPVEAITASARKLVYEAAERGWSGPPYDPFVLAELMRFETVPREDVRDARTVPSGAKRSRIEYNPNRPAPRMRYSVAHELGHTLFPDCHQRVRDRIAREHMRADDWQLEMLCNIAAAEILMPFGDIQKLGNEPVTVDRLLELMREYAVSAEAIFLRVVKLTAQACAMFCASFRGEKGKAGRYRIDYSVASRAWDKPVPSGQPLPRKSKVEECTAIGYTAKGTEAWPHAGKIRLECVGIPPYPGHRYPRIVGIIGSPGKQQAHAVSITYVRGDATEPRGEGPKIIAHVASDRARTWGAGFGLYLRKKWPLVQREFRRWAETEKRALVLGNVRLSRISDEVSLFTMIAQRGYGPSARPRIRYGHLKTCLDRLAEVALEGGTSVHMPRIGSGQGGGMWFVVEELVDDALCRRGVPVTVYELPSSRDKQLPEQMSLLTG